MQTQAVVILHLYTESCARRVHVASIKSIMVFPCVFASDIRGSFALQHACVTQQSIDVGFMCYPVQVNVQLDKCLPPAIQVT